MKATGKSYGFRLRFSKTFDYVFKRPVDRNRAIRQISAAMRLAGLTRADYHVKSSLGIRKGRGLKNIPFQPRLIK